MTTPDRSARWKGLAALFGIAALGLLGYWSASTWLRPLLAPATKPLAVLAVAAGCDWMEGCETEGVLRARVRVDRRVRPLQPFELTLAVDPDEISAALVDFVMVGMDMGVNRFSLTPAAGAWRTRAVLPVCTVDRQDWLAQIHVTTVAGVYRIDVPFQTERE